jgi:hypothetical protein
MLYEKMTVREMLVIVKCCLKIDDQSLGGVLESKEEDKCLSLECRQVSRERRGLGREVFFVLTVKPPGISVKLL